MTTYQLEGSGPDDGKALVRVAWMLVIATAFGVLAGLRNAPAATALWGVVLAIPILTVAQLAGMQRARARRRRERESYRLMLDDRAIRRTLAGYADLQLQREEVVRIEAQEGGLVVHGRSSDQQIFIPRYLDGFNDVRLALASWTPIEQPAAARGLAGQKQLLAFVAEMALFGAIFLSDRPAIVVPAAILFIAGGLVAIWLIRKSPAIDTRTKRMILATLMPMAAAGYKAWLVLSR
jgi:hypothetical protein